MLPSPFFKLLLCALAAYIIIGAFLFLGQTSLIFPAPKNWPNVSPASCGLQFEELRIPAARTGQIHAWWIPAAAQSDKALLAFHGNGYVLQDMVGEELLGLHGTGANVLAIDYRGYGLSSSVTPNEHSVVEDARVALAYLLHTRRIPAHNVFVLGRSVGSGAATELASELQGLGGLILESPFTSLDTVAAGGFWLFRLYPLHLLLRTHFDNLSKMRSISAPLLIVAGTADTLTPPSMARALFEAAKPPKRLYMVEGADHNDLSSIGKGSLAQVLREFVQGRK